MPRAAKKRTKPADPKVGFTTYCIRLTQSEKELFEKALATTGSIPTRFIRNATLERAAHIENTSTPTSFPFDRLARRLAEQLCEPRILVGNESDVPIPIDRFFEQFAQELVSPGTYALTDPPSLGFDDISRLRDAVRLGGAEFLSKIVDYCDQLQGDQRPNLPPPIDPANLG